MSNDNIALAINVTPRTFCEKNIKLNIADVVAGNYSMTFVGLETFKQPVIAVLKDNFLGTTTTLTPGYVYNFSITADAASSGSGRFVVTEKNVVATALSQ